MTASPLTYKYPVQIRPNQRATHGRLVWLATHPDLPGCFGYGDTKAEALESLQQSRVAYIQHLLAKGFTVPQPSEQIAEIVELENATPAAPLTIGKDPGVGEFVRVEEVAA
ncbi:hypothetical protein BH23GEM2_BH23GEM2_14800 [soil metagenome]